MNVSKIVTAYHEAIQASKEFDKNWRKGVDWNDPEAKKQYSQLYDKANKAERAMREAYKDMVKAWCAKRGVTVNVRSEMRLYARKKIEWGDTSVWNDKDSVRSIGSRKVGNWTNKVTVMDNGRVRTHKIRTDAAMLGKFAEDLAAFVKEVIEEVNKEIKHGTD